MLRSGSVTVERTGKGIIFREAEDIFRHFLKKLRRVRVLSSSVFVSRDGGARSSASSRSASRSAASTDSWTGGLSIGAVGLRMESSPSRLNRRCFNVSSWAAMASSLSGVCGTVTNGSENVTCRVVVGGCSVIGGVKV